MQILARTGKHLAMYAAWSPRFPLQGYAVLAPGEKQKLLMAIGNYDMKREINILTWFVVVLGVILILLISFDHWCGKQINGKTITAEGIVFFTQNGEEIEYKPIYEACFW